MGRIIQSRQFGRGHGLVVKGNVGNIAVIEVTDGIRGARGAATIEGPDQKVFGVLRQIDIHGFLTHQIAIQPDLNVLLIERDLQVIVLTHDNAALCEFDPAVTIFKADKQRVPVEPGGNGIPKTIGIFRDKTPAAPQIQSIRLEGQADGAFIGLHGRGVINRDEIPGLAVQRHQVLFVDYINRIFFRCFVNSRSEGGCFLQDVDQGCLCAIV